MLGYTILHYLQLSIYVVLEQTTPIYTSIIQLCMKTDVLTPQMALNTLASFVGIIMIVNPDFFIGIFLGRRQSAGDVNLLFVVACLGAILTAIIIAVTSIVNRLLSKTSVDSSAPL